MLWAFLLCPHTSLPYVRIGMINVSKIWNIIWGGGCCTFFSFCKARNVALLALSHRYGYFVLNISCAVVSVDLMILPRYLYSLTSSILLPLNIISPVNFFLPKIFNFVLASLTIILLRAQKRLKPLSCFWMPFSVFENSTRSSAQSRCATSVSPIQTPVSFFKYSSKSCRYFLINIPLAAPLDWHLLMTLLQDWVYRLFSLYNVFWNTGTSACLLHDRSNHLS